MRTIALASLLLLTSVASQHGTETIRLRHGSAVEVEDKLTRAPLRLSHAGELLVWHADGRSNTFQVAGTPDAVREFKHVIELVDIPLSKARLWVGTAQIDPTRVGEGVGVSHPESANPPTPEAPSVVSGLVKPAELPGIRAAAKAGGAMTVGAHHTAHVRWWAEEGDDPGRVSITPIVNGSGDVTLTVDVQGRWSADGQPLPPVKVLRRLPAGRALLVQPQRAGVSLIVHVEGVEQVNPPKRP